MELLFNKKQNNWKKENATGFFIVTRFYIIIYSWFFLVLQIKFALDNANQKPSVERLRFTAWMNAQQCLPMPMMAFKPGTTVES